MGMAVTADWDTRLDSMLADLETGTHANSILNNNNNNTNSVMQKQQQQQFSSSYSSSSHQQQHFSKSEQFVQQQSSSYSTSSQQHHQISHQQQPNQLGLQQAPTPHTPSLPTAGQGLAGKYGGGGYHLNKSASTASLKDSAGGVLKDLEDGLVKSSHYIQQESHGKVSGPDGTREWHEVKRSNNGGGGGGGPAQPGEFNLEMQVQHMMPSLPNNNNSYNINTQQQQQQQQYSSYRVQSNQYNGGNNNVELDDEDDERPGSRLKQNIDELDTLLYDLNHARHLSPDQAKSQATPSDYNMAPSSDNFGLDSDDYSETVGKEGHVKRTVHAFNEYSTHTSAGTDPARKPPSPSPRRKATNSPPAVRRTAPSPTITQQKSSSQSYQVMQQTSNTTNYNHQPYQPTGGPPGSGQPFAYLPDTTASHPQPSTPQPSAYSNDCRPMDDRPQVSGVPFSHQPATRSPTAHSLPKRVDDLMSEFQEFESVHQGGSPTPPTMFRQNNSTLVVTELPDGPPVQDVDPTPVVRAPSPPRSVAVVSPKGPQVYYPPGAEFTKPERDCGATADQAGTSLHQGGAGKGQAKGRAERYDRGDGGENKQGAAVIPICLPLCCAAPCVIL